MKRVLITIVLLVTILSACGDSGTYGVATDVHNDKTGNWKKVVTSKKFDAETDTLDYYEEYMEEGEIHFVVSFATNTTTVIRDLDGLLSVSVHEYEEKEEHDAETIGSGMLLKEYNIYHDGEIEEIN